MYPASQKNKKKKQQLFGEVIDLSGMCIY